MNHWELDNSYWIYPDAAKLKALNKQKIRLFRIKASFISHIPFHPVDEVAEHYKKGRKFCNHVAS